MLKFPYGVADFYKIMTEGYYYVDRTDRIPLLEKAGDVLLFLRPRRFGKSLLMSTLENYYDIRRAAEFERLFGHLAIGRNPTPKRNQYFMLKWNFSAVSTQGNEDAIQRALYDHINGCIEEFIVRYQDRLSHQIVLDPNGLRSFQSVLAAVQGTPYKLYLLIDEYDNFANAVLMGGRERGLKRYETLIEGEGLLKELFKNIKAGLEGRGLDRVFLTGVSPVVMSDVTSSFNVVKNIYLKPEYHDLCGFREDEVAVMVQQVAQNCGFSAEQSHNALETMRTFYNGYSFTIPPTSPPNLGGDKRGGNIYNSTLTLYFLEQWQESCRYPREMLDSNLAMDRLKIAYIASLRHGEQVIAQALNEEHPLVAVKLADRFGVRDMLRESNDNRFMVSLLYYFGVLTMTENYTEWGSLTFKIPNLVTKQLYVERIRESLLPTGPEQDEVQAIAIQFYQTGDLQPVCEFIEQKYYPLFDNRDYRWTNELTMKAIFMTVFFNDIFYIMDSETALEREFGDLTMIVRPDMRQFKLLDFLFEFKYISLKTLGLTAEEIRPLDRAALMALPLVKKPLSQAKRKLKGYRQILQKNYGEKLRLHVYAVVAVGYERLVWVKV